MSFDLNLMKIVIKNLLLNAIDNSQPNEDISITVVVLEEIYTITIADRGPGIPEELHQQVFDNFFRIPRSQVGVSGVGVGLSIVKKVVDIHKGMVKIVNRPERGIEITMTMPIR